VSTVAEILVRTLALAGVKRVHGLPGDSLNGVTDSLRTHADLEWVHYRNEEAAAFAAGAEAHLTDRIAVCAGSCGPGNLHFINGLYDCQRSRVPVLAIASQIPSSEIGTTYFQETNPQALFKDCSDYCGVISQPDQMPRILAIAMRTAIAKRGVAVVVLPGDVAVRDCPAHATELGFRANDSVVVPPASEIASAVALLADAKSVTILAGAGCAGAHAELLQIAERLQAPIVHAFRGKEFVEYDNPYDVGMTGLL
jgi:pyruvate dehydrogenase (quinone)